MNSDPYRGRLIRLRAREESDEPAFHRWFHDPEITNWLAIRYPISHTGERRFLTSAPDAGFEQAAFAVEVLEDGRLVGNCVLRCHAEDRRGTLGIAMGERDRGFGTDTMRTLCRVGFEVINLHRIELTVDATNERARHVYRGIGFREEGELRDHRFLSGAYRGTVVMGLFRNELKMGDEA